MEQKELLHQNQEGQGFSEERIRYQMPGVLKSGSKCDLVESKIPGRKGGGTDCMPVRKGLEGEVAKGCLCDLCGADLGRNEKSCWACGTPVCLTCG